ncbi:MAG: DUF1579 family protein [Planctomycetota bacterium]
MTRTVTPFAVLVCVLSTSAPAQDQMPGPAPELKKLEPLLGNWSGTGKMTEPGGVVTQWQAHGTWRWCLDGHFLQEDLAVAFTGIATPMVIRGYYGWDREHGRYVHLTATSAGQIRMHELKLMPDGGLLQIMVQDEAALPYAERSVIAVAGDTMTHTIDLLLPEGASMAFIDSRFTRGGEAFGGAFTAPPFMDGKPHEAVARLCKSAGAYETKGEMILAPGQGTMKISGTDTFLAVFGGTVLHGHTDGAAEGMPGKYEGEVFWGWDSARKRILGIYVSNMGEVMTMDAWWSSDGRLISTMAGVYQGQPTVQRMLMEFDVAGAAKSAVGHTIAGTAAPFESFRCTYTKKK